MMHWHIIRLGLIISAILMASCATVKPPQRPVAYIYPSLVPMSAIKCTPTQLATEAIRELLKESRTLAILENAGLQTGEIAILSRGLAKHGYAELDARRSKSIISWVSISCQGETTIIRAIYRKKPAEFNRFGIPTNNMTKSMIRGYYGELKTVATVSKDNVTLKNVNSNKSSSWEVIVSLSRQ